MGISFGNFSSAQPQFGLRNVRSEQDGGNNARKTADQSSAPKTASGCSQCGGSHGADFNHDAVVAAGKNPSVEFEKFKAKQYADILGHEQAHQSAAGSLGGGINIQYDGNGVAVAGHVPISIPGMDIQNPGLSYENYSTVRNAALAPGDPSGQDRSVASTALGLMGQAQVLMSQKRQAQSAGIPLDEFKKLGGNAAAVEKARQRKENPAAN